MTKSRLWFSVAACAALVALLVPALVLAQGTTTGNLGGRLTDDNGAPLPGVQVTAVHQPTGTRYIAFSRDDGRYLVQNVRAGGPYSVTAELQGFSAPKRSGIQVRLGEQTEIDLKLQLAGVEEAVIVTGETPIISSSRTGATTSVAEETLTALPTINRSFQDIARTNPYFNTEATGGLGFSVAGRNNRYNNIQIDGAVNNDVFGLASSGTPGGQTDTQPISLDAIQELQLVVSPYDVRQGGFSGGAINAITKSGSNDFHGGAFYYQWDDSLVGKRNDKEIATFDAKQLGLNIGGPILRDKLFFFANFEQSRRKDPTGWSADGTSGSDFCEGNATCYAEVDRFRSILQNTYGYDPGSSDEFSGDVDSDNIFARLDFNANESNQMTLRHNYVDATKDRMGSMSVSTFRFPDWDYIMGSETNSTVLQANSIFGNDKFNEFRVTYQTIRDVRNTPNDPFPQVSVRLTGSKYVYAGTEQYSGANSLDQDIIELTDDFSFTLGDHTITLGTHNEMFSFTNVYIRDFYGTYQFGSLDSFEHGWASRFDHSFSTTGNPKQAAEFDVQQYGFYAGDQWRVLPNLSVTAGIRVDIPYFPDRPTRNPDTEVLWGVRTDVAPDGNPLWSPRVGFNWDIAGDQKSQLRGGVGMFSGRTPYVWLSNQYGNTGNEFRRILATKTGNEASHIDFISDPYNQPQDVGANQGNEVDVVDPDLVFPQVLRTTLGFDRDLGFWGLFGKIEGTWSLTKKEMDYQNLNLVETGNYTFDGRPIYTKVATPAGYTGQAYSNAIYIKNTDKGESWTGAVTLEKPFSNGFFASASYLYGESESISDLTSSQAYSNWQYNVNEGYANHAELGRSQYDPGHRFNVSLSYSFDLGPTRSNIGVYYNRQSGRPYSTVFAYTYNTPWYNTSINGDNATGNDLLYVPKDSSDVKMAAGGGTWEELDAYIEGDNGLRDWRGSIVPRNASRSPYTNMLDFHYGFEVPIFSTKAEISFDIMNLLNLIDEDKGQIKYISYSTAPIEYRGVDSATGKPIYFLRTWARNGGPSFNVEDLRSRWQAKLGARFSF